MKEVFLISEQTIKSRTILNNNVDVMYIAPSILDRLQQRRPLHDKEQQSQECFPELLCLLRGE